MPNENTSFLEETAEHVQRTRELADAASSLVAFNHGMVKWVEDGSEYAQRLDKLAALVQSSWNPSRASDSPTLAVLHAFIGRLPSLRLVNTQHDEEHAEFHWAFVRCILAGAGYESHSILASQLANLYPLCPLDPCESHDVWLDKLNSAHHMSGLPVTLMFMDWRDIWAALPTLDRSEHFAPNTLVAFTLLHVLKHVRRVNQTLQIFYAGSATRLTLPDTANTVQALPWVKSSVAHALHVLGDSRAKEQHLGLMAWNRVLPTLELNSFLTTKPLTDLPGYVLTGPWARPAPSAQPIAGFFHTGLHLDGVWLARNGTIGPYQGDDSDVLSYSWNVDDAKTHEMSKQQFAALLPATYTAGNVPSDIWFSAFPNAEETWLPTANHRTAYRAMLDAVLVASFIRHQLPSLQYEFPLILVFPSTPSVEESTNQGKTTAALAFARAMSPSLTRAISVMRSASAPNQRALAADLGQHGTLCLDEWAPIDHDDHLLSHKNVQNMCVGGTAAIGRAMENSGGVTLKFSLTASIKAADFPPDMVNRSIPIYLNALSADARTNDVGEKLRNGLISLEMRFAALSLIESTNIVEHVGTCNKSTAGWRFPWHNAIAEYIYTHRTGEAPGPLIGEVLHLIQQRVTKHAEEADATGLMTQLREGVRFNMSHTAFFENMTDLDIGQLLDVANQHGCTHEYTRYLPPAAITRARRDAMGARTSGRMLEMITGTKASITDRSMARAVTTALCAACPNCEDVWPIPGTTYKLTRAPKRVEDLDGRPLFLITH